MKRCLASLTALLLVVTLSGCYETAAVYSVNPDGSGKVVLNSTFQGGMMNLAMGEEKTADQKLKDAVRGLLEKSEGIDTWSKVTATTLDDGRIEFKGTAYFKDLAKVKLKNVSDAQLAFTRTPAGHLSLSVKFGKDDKAAKTTAPPAALTEEQITAKIKEQKMGYQQAKPMMAGILGTMKNDLVFLLPGTVKTRSNITQLPNGALRATFDGAKLLAAMDTLMLDDAFLREQVKAGKNPMKSGPTGDNAMNKILFGSEAPVQAVVAGPFKPRFDYAAEVAAARAAYPAILKQFGAAAPIPAAAPSEGGALKGVTVAGIQLVRSADSQLGINPLNQQKPGYMISIIAELPGAAIKVSEARLTKAVADTGQDLMPERDWDRKATFPKLSKDSTMAILGFKLALPGPAVKGIEEFSGTIEYISASGTKKVDLGISEFKAGAQGSELGAAIKSLGIGKWTKKPTLELRLAAPKASVKTITFYDAAGAELECRRAGSMSSGDTYTPSFTVKDGGEFPAAGKIVIEVFDNQKKFIVPFKLENFSLLGTPM